MTLNPGSIVICKGYPKNNEENPADETNPINEIFIHSHATSLMNQSLKTQFLMNYPISSQVIIDYLWLV